MNATDPVSATSAFSALTLDEPRLLDLSKKPVESADDVKVASIEASSGPLTLEQVRDKLAQVAIKAIKAIVADNEARTARYAEDPSQLNQGFFYGNEYMKALQVTGNAPRLVWFLKKGSFFHGFTSSKCFEMQKGDSSSGVIPSRFVIKKDVLPTQALDSLRDTINFMGCGEITQIAQYQALRDVWGDEKFNALFAADSRTPFQIHHNSPDSPMGGLTEPVQNAKGFKVGQVVHFANIQLYKSKHVNGEAGGFNAVCVDDTPGKELFTTLGLHSAGMTQAQIRDQLYKEFNAPSLGMTMVTKEVGQRILGTFSHPQLFKISQYTQKIQFTPEEMTVLSEGGLPRSLKVHAQEIARIGGSTVAQAKEWFTGCGKVAQVTQLNASRVHQIATSSMNDARILLDQWHGKFLELAAKNYRP